MNILQISQITGLISFVILITIKLYLVANQHQFAKYGRIAMLWIVVYFYFLFLLRLLSFLGIGTRDDLTIIAGFSTTVPLIAILYNLFLVRKEPETFQIPIENKKLEIKTEVKLKKENET